MKRHKKIDKNLKIIFELLDIDWNTTPKNHKADFREAMRQIMSDSYIQGSQECDDLILYTLYPNALELIKSLQIEIGELKNNVMVFRDEKNLAIKRWSELSKENQSLKRNHEPEPLDYQT